MPSPRAKQIRLLNEQGRGKVDLWQSAEKKAKIAELLSECEKLERKKKQYIKEGDKVSAKRADDKIALVQKTLHNMDR